MARDPADRDGPTDPDEDDIKRILESMWEIKSRDDGRSVIPDDGQLQGDNVDFYDIEPLNADGFEGVARDHDVIDVEPESASSERLADRLKGVGADLNSLDASSWSAESAAAKGVDPNDHSEASGASGAPDAHQLLSTLSCKEGGQSSAVNKMGTQTPQGDAHKGPANGHGLNGSNIVIEHAGDEGGLEQGGVQSPEAIAVSQRSPGGGASEQQETPAQDGGGAHVEDPIVKREMASFFDSRMKGMAAMGGGSPAPSPRPAPVAPAPQAAAPAPAPVAAAPAAAPVARQPAPQQGAPTAAPTQGGGDSAAELMRPVLRQWLGENMPKIVESALQIEAAESAGREDVEKPDK